MEYSVGQLILKLLKRWYVILIVMCAFVGIGLFLSQQSYEKAVAEYDAYTEEILPATTGTLTAQFSYNIQESVVHLLKNLVRQIQSQSDLNRDYTRTLEEMANAYLQDSVIEKKLQEVIIQISEQNIAPGYDLSACVQLNYPRDFLFDITIMGLEEPVGRDILEEFETVLSEDPLLRISCTKSQFVYDDPEYSERALFSQLVMTEPVEKPNRIKVGGTAAVFGFAVACIGILLAEFVKDAKKQQEDPAQEE